MNYNNSETSSREKPKNIFVMYAIIFRLLFSKTWKSGTSKEEELEKLILPSNEQWRQKVYYKLVELQRGIDVETKKKKNMEHDEEVEDIFQWQWDPKGKLALILPSTQKNEIEPRQSSSVPDKDNSNWTIYEIILAARVLEQEKNIYYNNEYIMRKVLTLVYDVLRFKPILSQVLDDVKFWQFYTELKNREKIVLLLLYDMQTRKPVKLNRIPIDNERRNAFNEAGLWDIEEALLKYKISLSASFARLRIRGQALKFDDLLPLHLRTSDISCTSGWVNTMKIPNQRIFINEMSKLGFSVCYECHVSNLNENLYNFDPLCPKVVNFHKKAREKLAVSDLVQKFCFIFLERSLCFGAAALYHAIRVEKFCGPVVLTHPVAPRHVAYLSILLSDIEYAGRLLVFGAGDKRKIYEHYLYNLGITFQQCKIFSESYVTSVSSSELERATVVLATPCSSYSGIADIVDLAIAKGGDIKILESLTNSDILQEPKDLISEQLSTLKYALKKPNVQLLIYEVHSILPCETTQIVKEVLDYVNKLATEKYIKLNSTTKKRKKDKLPDKNEKCEDLEEPNLIHTDIQIPNCDLFEAVTLNDIYDEENINNSIDAGCFLSVLKRKDMEQFNSIYMIKFAESKGLFGNPDASKDQRLSLLKEPLKVQRKSIKKQSLNLDRITSHTHSSLIKTRKKSDVCAKVNQRASLEKNIISSQVLEAKELNAKRWWMDSANYLISPPQAQVVRFRLLRTDPITHKFLCPLTILKSMVVEQNDGITAVIS